MKNEFLAFAVLAIAFVGIVGGVGFSVYNGAYLIAVCVAALGVLAYPTIKKAWDTIRS